jgi:hypothetical protein
MASDPDGVSLGHVQRPDPRQRAWKIGATYHIVTLQAGKSHLTSFRQTTSHHNVIK